MCVTSPLWLTSLRFEASLRAYPLAFGSHFASVIHHLIAKSNSIPQPDDEEYSAFDEKAYFANLKFLDLWDDAGVVDIIGYLRGNCRLTIPEGWRPVIPRSLKLDT